MWAPTSDGSKEAAVVCNVGAGEEGKGRRVEEEEEKGVEKDRDTGAGAVEDVVWSGGEPAGAVDDRPAEKGEREGERKGGREEGREEGREGKKKKSM